MKLKYTNGREANDGDPVIFLAGQGKIFAGTAFATDEGGGCFPNTSIGVNVSGRVEPFFVDCNIIDLENLVKNPSMDRGMYVIYHAEDAFKAIDKT